MSPLVFLTLVDATTIVPRLKLDIHYATVDNFTHQRLYAHAAVKAAQLKGGDRAVVR